MILLHENRLLRKTIQDLNALRLKGKQTQLVIPGVNAAPTMKSSRPTGSVIAQTKPTVTNLPGRTPGGSTIIGRSPRAMQQNATRQQATYQTNLAKNAATVSGGFVEKPKQYINVETPGGTIGYDAELYNPVLDENGNVTGVTNKTDIPKPTQPNNPVRTLADRGMFKPSESNPTKLIIDEAKVTKQVDERRNQRLMDMGINPDHEVVDLIDKGGKYDGVNPYGEPIILMPDGSRVPVRSYSGEQIQNLSLNKDKIDKDTITKEVKDEYKDTYTGTDSSIGGKTQGTEGDTTGMGGSSTSLATQGGLGQKYDLTPFQTTQSSIADLQSQIKNLSPDLQAAVLPSLMALQASSDLSMKTASALISNLPTDQEITAGYGTLENYILDQDAKYKDILEKNKQQSLAVANYNRDALEIEKKLNDHNAYVAEQQQAQKNIETEKALRRQVNKLGIQTDTSGLDYLNTEIQKGIDALNNLKTANNLVSLRAQLAIGEGYKLDVKNALNTYEGNYLQITSQTTEALRSVKNDIAMKIEERDKEIRSILEKAVEKKSANDMAAADRIYQANVKMIDIRKQDMRDAADREDKALERIDYLLKNYPRASVADAIRSLGKDVTSFDVESLIENPSLSELKRAEDSVSRSRSGGAFANTLLPDSLKEVSGPTVSLNEFMTSKLTALEKSSNQSFSVEKRAKIMDDNAAEWEKEYNATYLDGHQVEAAKEATQQLVDQFGQQVVDAAQLVLDGTYGGTNAIKNASEALGVSESAVATALTKLKRTGSISDTAVLSAAQQKSRDSIIAQIKTDPFYTVWTGSKSAVTRINTAIGDNGGADGLSDIMAINAFQNGIVDPGATVREGDVALMQTAIAWAQLAKLDTWKERIADGDKLPAQMRAKMLQLATATRDAYARDFQSETVPKVQSLIKQNGLPPSVLDSYIGESVTPSVSPQVRSFVDSLPPI